MKVKELILALIEMPQDAEMSGMYDGAARVGINFVWLARSGEVIFCDEYEYSYYNEDRPISAPDEKQVIKWSPKKA